MASSLNIVLKTVFVLIALSSTSCKKDKVPEPCTGVTLEGQRASYVGKWRWYKTRISQWFDIGPDYFYDVTPTSEGFEYYFIISNDGLYKGYKNDSLVHVHILSEISHENYDNSSLHYLSCYSDCGNEIVDLTIENANGSLDSLRTRRYPLNFVDNVAKKRSLMNYFVRE